MQSPSTWQLDLHSLQVIFSSAGSDDIQFQVVILVPFVMAAPFCFLHLVRLWVAKAPHTDRYRTRRTAKTETFIVTGRFLFGAWRENFARGSTLEGWENVCV